MEKVIGELEARVRSSSEPTLVRNVDVSSDWIRRQLSDLAAFLNNDVPRVKAEFRGLSLALTFNPVEGEPSLGCGSTPD